MSKKKWIIAGIAVIVAAVAAFGIFSAKKGTTNNNAVTENSAVTEKAELPSGDKTEKAEAKPEEVEEEKKDAAPAQTEKKSENNKEEKKEEAAKTEVAEPENVQPQFLYFVDNKTEEAGQKIIDDFKAKYPGVLFELKNIEKDPEIIENFSLVEGNIPALITVDKTGMLGFEFKCSDKGKLEDHVKKISGK